MRDELRIDNLINFIEEKYNFVFYRNWKFKNTNYYEFITNAFVASNGEYDINIYSLKQLRDIYKGE